MRQAEDIAFLDGLPWAPGDCDVCVRNDLPVTAVGQNLRACRKCMAYNLIADRAAVERDGGEYTPQLPFGARAQS